MTQVDRPQFKTDTGTLYPDNTSAQISPADIRAQMDNIADSASFAATGKTVAPSATDDIAGTAGNGRFQVGDTWIDETSDDVYTCVDNSTNAAVWKDLTIVQTGAEIEAAIDAQIGNIVWKTGNQSTVNDQTGTAYTLGLSDNNNVITMNNAAPNTVTLPTNAAVAIPIGTIVSVIQLGTGSTTIAGDTAVIVNGVATGVATITDQHNTVSILKIAADVWNLQGSTGGVA
jgi:hypothetical protein